MSAPRTSDFNNGCTSRATLGGGSHATRGLVDVDLILKPDSSARPADGRSRETSLLTGSSKAPMAGHGRQEPGILNGGRYHDTSITRAQATHGALSFMQVNDLEGIGTWTDNYAHGASPQDFEDEEESMEKTSCSKRTQTSHHDRRPPYQRSPSAPFAPFELPGFDQVDKSQSYKRLRIDHKDSDVEGQAFGGSPRFVDLGNR